MVTTEMPEAKFSQQDFENQAVLDELLKAKQAPEPGDFMQDRIVNKGSEDLPVPIVADSLVSAGYVWVYDTKTGEASRVNRNFLVWQLRKLYPDGTWAFTLKAPKTPPVRGSLLCMLHPDSPSRKDYDRIGYKACLKANLVTEFDVEQHMKARHKKEWASIQAEKTRREKEEDRALQRQTMVALSGLAGSKPVSVTPKPTALRRGPRKPKESQDSVRA